MAVQYLIIQDDREKKPLIFPTHLTMLDPYQHPTKTQSITVNLSIEKRTLRTGDYLLAAYPRRTIVERKGHLYELAHNLLTSQDRKRFIRECVRLRDECDVPVIMVEGTLSSLMAHSSRMDYSPWLVVDAIQRVAFEYGLQTIFLPADTPHQRRIVGEQVAHLLINGAITPTIPVLSKEPDHDQEV